MPLISKPTDAYGNRTWYVSTVPTVEPITVDEVKSFGNIDSSDENTLIEGYIKAVREATQNYLGRSLIEQSITLLMDFWPGIVIELPMPPLISITGVYTTDEDGTDTTYASTNYMTITSTETRGKLILRQGATAPTNTDRDYGGFKVVYKAGYGNEATDVPQSIREGMKLWTAIFYETRALMQDNQPPPEVKNFLDFYRVLKI